MVAEAGHHPNRVYVDDSGDFHLNGAKVWDVNEVDCTSAVNIGSVTSTPTELNQLHSVTAGTTSASKALVVGASKNLDALLLTVATDRLLRLSPQATEAAYSATMTIDVTYSCHIISAISGTSATLALTPSAAGSAGDILVIATQTDGSGQVVTTFSSTFKSSGTQTSAASRFSTIIFVSNGSAWLEVCRTTALS